MDPSLSPRKYVPCDVASTHPLGTSTVRNAESYGRHGNPRQAASADPGFHSIPSVLTNYIACCLQVPKT